MKIGDLVRNINTEEIGLIVQGPGSAGWIMILYSLDDIEIGLQEQVEVIND